MRSQKRILLVEDESRIRVFIRDYLLKEGFLVDEAVDGERALEAFNEKKYDLVLLDIMMPKMDGWQVCKEIRHSSDVIIIMLTAKDGEANHLQGYDLGANDYIEKPFSPRVLMAKIKASLGVTTHSKKHQVPDVLTIKELQIDRKGREAYLSQQKISFTLKEFDLLVYLAENNKQALSRQQILDQVWGRDYAGTDRTIDACVKRIRTKLGSWELPLQAIRGIGYRLEIEE